MSNRQILVVGEQNGLFEMINNNISDAYHLILMEPHHIRAELKSHSSRLALVIKNKKESAVDLIQMLIRERPELCVIYIDEQPDFELLREIIRVGALDYIVMPDEMEVLTNKIESLLEKADANVELAAGSGTYKRGGGRIFTFYSGKGGSGKTFLSTTFAQTMKLESTAQVLYIDLNLQFGGSETFLGIESNRSLYDLKPVINELNEHHIKNVTEKETHSKLEVLLSPRDAELAENINSEFITRLLRACRRSYDFIIVDIPTEMDEIGYSVLNETDQIYYVMTLDTPSIRVLKSVEELFTRLGVSTEDRLQLIVNLAGRDNELSKKDLERFVKHPIAVEIRRDLKGVLSAINQGNPIRKETKEKKQIPAAKDIHKWVLTMLK
ncbi:AAA family ATPase [Bacillus sp. FJAT-49736]|uniref:AAA family ATPase n=1 Tax=Bacillus sp. FJAT-49736 TaxID=2833582 RepID=UPI001BC9D8E2|nr:AAA family ATPase [Bacillus sp. FJAT-49736]MBS4175845.1 AAA family ATPase [Bacillus sp. FJAT-49736]